MLCTLVVLKRLHLLAHTRAEEKVEMEGMKDRKKRRMGLVFGYVGTEYYGLQKSTNPDVQIRTIESVLEKVSGWAKGR